MKYSSKMATSNLKKSGHLKHVIKKNVAAVAVTRELLDNMAEEEYLNRRINNAIEWRSLFYTKTIFMELEAPYEIVGGALKSADEIFREWIFQWTTSTGRKKTEVFRAYLNVKTLMVRFEDKSSGFALSNSAYNDLFAEKLRAAKTLLYDVVSLRPNVLDFIKSYRYKTNKSSINVCRGEFKYSNSIWIGDAIIMYSHIHDELPYGTYYIGAKGYSIADLCGELFTDIAACSSERARLSYKRQSKLNSLRKNYFDCLYGQNVYSSPERAANKRNTKVFQVPNCFKEAISTHDYRILNIFYRNGKLFAVTYGETAASFYSFLHERIKTCKLQQKKKNPKPFMVIKTKITDDLVREFRSSFSACHIGTKKFLDSCVIKKDCILVPKGLDKSYPTWIDSIVEFCGRKKIEVFF